MPGDSSNAKSQTSPLPFSCGTALLERKKCSVQTSMISTEHRGRLPTDSNIIRHSLELSQGN